jgi:hypothetical protein
VPTAAFKGLYPVITINFTSINYTHAAVKLTLDEPIFKAIFNLTEGRLFEVTGCKQVGNTVLSSASPPDLVRPPYVYYSEFATFEALFEWTADNATIRVKPRVATGVDQGMSPASNTLVNQFDRQFHIDDLEIWGHKVPFGGQICVTPEDVQAFNIDESQVRGAHRAVLYLSKPKIHNLPPGFRVLERPRRVGNVGRVSYR